jgi:hypothetical protein
MNGEDGYDEPPEEYGMGCQFCFDYDIKYEEEAALDLLLTTAFFDSPAELEELLKKIPADSGAILNARRRKYPDPARANVLLCLYACEGRRADFEQIHSSAPADLRYLGEFKQTQHFSI